MPSKVGLSSTVNQPSTAGTLVLLGLAVLASVIGCQSTIRSDDVSGSWKGLLWALFRGSSVCRPVGGAAPASQGGVNHCEHVRTSGMSDRPIACRDTSSVEHLVDLVGQQLVVRLPGCRPRPTFEARLGEVIRLTVGHRGLLSEMAEPPGHVQDGRGATGEIFCPSGTMVNRFPYVT